MQSELSPGDGIIIARWHFDRSALTTMKNWQGRVHSLEEIEGKGLHFWVAWDSHTLMALPFRYLERCATKAIEWEGALVPVNKVRLVEPRDTSAEFEEAVQRTRERFHCISEYGKLGELAYQVTKDTPTLRAQEDAWQAYLSERVKFPFDAMVDFIDGWDEPDHYDGYPFLDEDEDVRVLGMDDIDNGMGVTVMARFRRREEPLPLCMLWPLGTFRGSKTIKAYRYWFETR